MSQSSEVHALLVAARETISDPARWCKSAHARTPSGVMVSPDDPYAAQWCAIGAVMRVLGQPREEDKRYRPCLSALSHAAIEQGYYGVGSLNDTSHHQTVLSMFDAAIAATAPDQEGA